MLVTLKRLFVQIEAFETKSLLKQILLKEKLWEIGKKLETTFFEKRRKTNAFTCTSFDEI